jgi:4-amino-4-deoxy-L-arabinose transferase-like glycosyltransferase
MRSHDKHHTSLSTRTVFLLTLIGSAILLAPTLTWDFAYDQGTFAYGGSALLKGLRPYIDFWDIKPPNIFYAYSAAFGIFGESVFSIRLLDYINALITIALLFELSIRLWTGTPWGRLSAVMTSLLTIVQYYIMGPWNTAQPETYTMPWILLAVLLLLPERDVDRKEKMIKVGLAGFAIGITVFFKYTNGIFLVLALAMLWISTVKLKTNHSRLVFAVLGGFAVAVGLQMLYLYGQGSLDDLFNIGTTATLSYRDSNYSGVFGLEENLKTLAQNLDLLWLVVAVIGWSLWSLDHGARIKYENLLYQTLLTVGLASALSLFVVQLQNKGYAYHYWIALPWLNILIGAGVAHFAISLHKVDALPRGSNAWIVGIVMVVLSYVWTSPGPLHARISDLLEVSADKRPANGYIEGDSVANFVIANTSPKDSIFIFGFHPYIYWRTGRSPANRYLNTIHFKPSYVSDDTRHELVASLVQRPPKLILVESDDQYTSQGDSFDDSRAMIMNRYQEVESLLLTYYDPIDTLQGTIIYRRR